MDTLFNILHVVAAVFIIGPMAILPQTALRSLRAGQGSQVRTLTKSANLFTLLSLVVVVLGFAVMGMSDAKYHISFASTWIWLSVVLYVIALGLSLFLVVPAMRRAGAELEQSEGAATAKRGYGAIAGSSGIVSLLLLAIVVLMVWKP